MTTHLVTYDVTPTLQPFIYEGRTESHEQLFFACKLVTADEGECGGRWNQLLCYLWASCDVNSLHHVTIITPNKMADNDMSFRLRAVMEFLVKEEIPAAEIHQRLQRAYGSVCMGASSVRRWLSFPTSAYANRYDVTCHSPESSSTAIREPQPPNICLCDNALSSANSSSQSVCRSAQIGHKWIYRCGLPQWFDFFF